MATVVASKPAGPATKMKKPAIPLVQTNANSTKPTQQPSSSPSSAIKRLPGQTPLATPVSATATSATSAARPNRRLQRLTTRNSQPDVNAAERKMSKKHPEPYVPKDSHILRKHKGKPPSLIVHLHPTHFRFDQQDGSFSYHSEMRIFIEHLQKGTIPHDMVEEFRKADVQYYDGWLIVRVVDHRSLANTSTNAGSSGDDGKPFSVHNYNPYITPSPYAPFPTREQTGARSPPVKQETRESSGPRTKEEQNNDLRSDDTVEVLPKSSKPQPRVFHVALRPTILSKHMDLVLDAMTPDPKSLNRKQSQANVNARNAPPQTPIAGVPPTPSTEKGPPPKKQKMKIDSKDLLDYEAKTVNATAPPLYLEPVHSLEDAEALIQMLKDPHHDELPPSPKSRKRTVAELAAEDAHAKRQERFMMLMDERNASTTGGTNAATTDAQVGASLFQPRFEKFNALENIKREIAERKQREKDRQLQEDENRRRMQEQTATAEEEKKRLIAQRTREMQMIKMRQQQAQAQVQQQQEMNMAAAQAHQAQIQHQPPIQRPQPQQASGIPPNMQSQMMAAQQRSSPIIRQGTPHAASSPIVNNMQQMAQPMAMSNSQQGHGSPPRPGSALQHAHPSAQMVRVPSGQGGPSRNGTPQIPNSTPGMRNATPVMRQGTPAQHMTQASPHGSMVAPTPQVGQVGMMPGQMQNGMPMQRPQQQQMTAQQAAEFNRRRQIAAMQQQMANGGPPMTQAQVAQLQAQQAQAERQAAMQRHQLQQQQAQQAAMQQQLMQQQQQGTPQMGQSPAAKTHAQYNASMTEQVKAKMASLQQQGQGQAQSSPAPSHMTPQQQQAQMVQAQQQNMMQQQMANMSGQQQQQQVQQRQPMNAQMQHLFQTSLNAYNQRFMTQAAVRYGGNTGMLTPHDLAQVQIQAKNAAMEVVRKKQISLGQQAMMRQVQAAQQQGGNMQNGMNMNMNMNMANMTPNMAAALQQQQQQQQAQQQAQQMQQLQMQQAQAQMLARQQAAQQAQQQQASMAGMQQYQQQLHNMQQQQQQGQR